MKSTFLTTVLSLFISAASAFAPDPPAGTGTAGDPYQIATLDHLYWLSQNSAEWVAGKYYIQTANIDASATNTWFPNGSGGYYGFPTIGGNADLTGNHVQGTFSGNYNGQGYSISNLYINRAPAHVAIFGYCSGTTIQNLRIVNAVVIATGPQSGTGVGILIGNSTAGTAATVTNVHIVGGSLTNSTYGCAGAFVGYGKITATNCTTSAAVTQSSGSGWAVGGFIGYLNSTSSFTNCGASGNVSSPGGSVGGFAGYISGSAQFSRCFSKGNVSASYIAGGFAGEASSYGGSFSNCYATGNVTVNNSEGGGFLGYADEFMSMMTFTNCYAKGVVSGSTSAGFGGYSYDNTYSNCFWDTQTTTKSNGFNYYSSLNVTGKTTAQMTTQSTFTGWDFTTTPVWKINATINNGYPYLGWETEPPAITSFTPASAVTGATVTITGTNFTGATAVSFGGTAAASFTVVNATTITAVIGAGATGIVSVTTPGGEATKTGFIMGKIWTGASSAFWNNAANWSPASVPETGAAIMFSALAANHLYADGNYTISSIDFNGSGKMLYLQTYTLNASSITGASAANYIISNNSSSSVKMNVPNGGTVVFHVGNTGYNPVSITNNTGSADDFSVNLVDEVYSMGTSGSPLTTNRVQRTWNISKTNPNAGSGIDFIFSWNESSEVVGVISSPHLFHYDGSTWSKQTGTTNTTSSSLTYTGYTGTFSPFSVMEGNSTLPVSWLSFTAQKQNKTVVLNWSTATEQNTEKFTAQHSTNGRTWKAIGTIAAAGNSNTVQQYTFNHLDAVTGINYYRLVQYDLDGKETYSKVISLNMSSVAKQVSVYPNPATNGRLSVKLETASTVQIFNSIGAVVFQKQLPAGTHQLPLEHFAKGIYRLKAGDDNVSFVIQ